ncbi:MAG: ATPase, T2SS/T4P/T4SS family [Patescibacteria group bacterium]
MTKKELAKALSKKCNISYKKAEELIDSFGSVVTDALSKGEKVIYSNFGSFYTVHYPSKIIYHPVLGKKKQMIMLPTNAVKWMPSGNVKELVDKGIEMPDKIVTHGASKIIKEQLMANSTAEQKPDPNSEIPIRVFRHETTIDEFQPRKMSSVAYIDLGEQTIKEDILSLIPLKTAVERRLVPFDEKNGVISLAMADPGDLDTIDLLEKTTGKIILPFLASETDLEKIFPVYPEGNTFAQEKMPSESPNRILSLLFKRAVREEASEIHVDMISNEIQIRFRIEGILYKRGVLPAHSRETINMKIKNLASLNEENRLPQTGKFSLQIDGHNINFEVSTMPLAFGEKILIRVDHSEKNSLIDFDDLGLLPLQKKTLKELTEKQGVFLILGPANSGKTTTAYALISNMEAESLNIITLEDPIKSRLDGVNQSQVDESLGYTYIAGYSSAILQSPDVIMIDKLDGSEITKLMFEEAPRGCLTMASLNIRDFEMLYKLLVGFKINLENYGSKLVGYMNQRLVKKVCPYCKEEASAGNLERQLEKEIESLPPLLKTCVKNRTKFYIGKGCAKCGYSGYKGMTPIFEVLSLNDERRSLMIKGRINSVIDSAKRDGFITLRQHCLSKVLTGETTIEELLKI